MTDWAEVWTHGGRRGIHLGNTAEFDAQFHPGTATRGNDGPSTAAAHRYADLAMFFTPHPAMVLLPGRLDPAWVELQRQALCWAPVELHTDIVDGPDLSRAVLARPALIQRIIAEPGPVVGWGHTPGTIDLLAATGRAVDPGMLSIIRSAESKIGANELFRQVATAHPEVVVPRQHVYGTAREAAGSALRHVRRGTGVVVKPEYGAGGDGIIVVTPATVREAGWRRRSLRRLIDPLTDGDRPIIVEKHVASAGPQRDLTVDAIVATDGSVHLVGVGVMDVTETRYRGVLIGPDVVPAQREIAASAFTRDVGHELARRGYRGWFDVDLVLDDTGHLVPTEINARVTGPAAAFCIAARLASVRGRKPTVRVRDDIHLSARLPEEMLYDHVVKLTRACDRLGAQLLPTLANSGYADLPTLGIALAADDTATVDLADGLVRSATHQLHHLVALRAPKTPSVLAWQRFRIREGTRRASRAGGRSDVSARWDR